MEEIVDSGVVLLGSVDTDDKLPLLEVSIQ